MKKRGFGVGKWNGIGGKVEKGERIKITAKREVVEEIGVNVKSLRKVAVLNFYFINTPDWDQQVVVFIADDWLGVPEESEEMKPRWFKVNKIPFKKMWWDDRYWLPQVLKGNKIRASFLFDEKEEVLDSEVKVVASLNVRSIS